MSPPRWAILGTGVIAQDFYAAVHTHIRVVAVSGSSPSKSEEFGGPRGLTPMTLPAVLSSPEIDIVYISLPTHLHAHYATVCLTAGKHVLVEKTFGMSEAEVRAVSALADSSRLFCMEANWMKFFPAMRFITQLIHTGELGHPVRVVADMGFHSSGAFRRHITSSASGGALHAVGVYPLSFALMVCPELEVVSATGVIEQGIDHSVAVAMASSTCSAEITASVVDATSCSATIEMSSGAVVTLDPAPHFISTTKVTVSSAHGPQQTHSFPLPDSEEEFHLPNSQGLLYEALEVEQCIAQGLQCSPLCTMDSTVAVAACIDHIKGILRVTHY